MKTFAIYRHKKSGEYEAVKQGWSWPAFFFSTWWALFKKLYGVFFILIGLSFLTHFLPQLAHTRTGAAQLNMFAGFIGIVTILLCGAAGNQWLANKLEKAGYEKIDTVEAANKEAALAPFVNKAVVSNTSLTATASEE